MCEVLLIVSIPIAAIAIIVVTIISIVRHINVRNNKIISESTDLDRGTYSERRLILTLRKFGIHPNAIYHDLYFRKDSGHFVQVDLVVPTKVGVIVFEVKDYSGWLFGNCEQKKWTQLLNYGKDRYYFYNPVLQNQEHIRHMRDLCPQLRNIPIYSVVVFSGPCSFRDITNVPSDVYFIYDNQLKDVLNDIFNNPLAHYTDKMEIVHFLNQAKLNGANSEIVYQHIKNIRSAYGVGFGERHSQTPFSFRRFRRHYRW